MLAMPRRALICGISGQDGAYLARLLLSKGYEVWGTSRDAQASNFGGLKTLNLIDKVETLSMSPEDFRSVLQIFSEVRPHEIYNLAGQSSVGLSFEQPLETMSSIAIGTLNQLEAIRFVDKSIRFYSAGSGECFGDTGALAASEATVFRPQSPYAVAKAAATWHVSVYRKSYDLFACTGILFNHESPLRPERFVTRKIVSAAQRIADGSNEKLKLGNIEIRRDWGWAPEYVDAMWRMLNREAPEDFVIATGVTQSLQEFVQAVFEEVGLDWRNHVVVDSTLLRPSDPMESVGNATKAKRLLDWNPTVIGREVPKRMLREHLMPVGYLCRTIKH
jgi:GDPmannose 4,6-dehydratase